MRLTIMIGVAALAVGGTALLPTTALAQYWGYNQNGGVVALPHHFRHHGRHFYPASRSYNRDLPPGGAVPEWE
jgi:hypothetical protein